MAAEPFETQRLAIEIERPALTGLDQTSLIDLEDRNQWFANGRSRRWPRRAALEFSRPHGQFERHSLRPSYPT
jgi:hypothetical protein